jgi:hypothetical protein
MRRYVPFSPPKNEACRLLTTLFPCRHYDDYAGAGIAAIPTPPNCSTPE